ncbi:MAG: cupin domain-containing protein [Nanoarchaeota archaeon]
MENNSYKPEKHKKGWGYEDWIANKKEYCGKLLFFEKGKRCSIHYHKLKDETFFLFSGKMKILLSNSPEDYDAGKKEEIVLNVGECLYIWPGRVHRMEAIEDSNLMEFSTEHFEEDSYRIEKGD